MNFPSIVLSVHLMVMILLIFPFLTLKLTNFQYKTKTAIKSSFFLSTIPLLTMLNEHLTSFTMSWTWFNILSTQVNLSIYLDFYSILFIPVALFVTWNITEFSLWYMKTDPKIELFFKYLLIFLLAMMLLVSTNNLLILFVGWEGVGIMSYLLIGWYYSRNNAGAAALQAILYNRIGDVGFLVSLLWLLTTHNSSDLDLLLFTKTPTLIIMALILAAASKSAQFSLHPWLASAMEGPTPVSALLHSSTMVVAGVFLLIRIHPAIKENQLALTTCLCLGAISTAFAAASALTQNDIKKIIAYSTASQLGLMIVAIGLNLPQLAFFHICTHAFFKAMLFMCSGSIIHNLNDEQDLRKMGGLQKTLPITTSCVSIGSLALMGTPYLAGFFSKDAIIEATLSSYVNTWALILTIMATSFSTVYSFRIIFFASLNSPLSNSLVGMNENNPTAIKPIKRLALGSITAGLLINQIMPLTSSTTLTLPTHLKTTALLVSLLGFSIAFDLAWISWTIPPYHLNITKKTSTLFYPIITHRLIPNSSLNFGLHTSHLIDSFWLEKTGPTGTANLHLPAILKNQEAQKGLIYNYLSTFVLTMLTSSIILQLV